MINTLESLDSLVYIQQKDFFKTHSDACSKYTKKSSPWCIQHRGVETRWCIHTLGSHFTDFKEHTRTTIFKGSIIIKLTVSYVNYLGTCDLCLQKLPKLRNSNQHPGVFIDYKY